VISQGKMLTVLAELYPRKKQSMRDYLDYLVNERSVDARERVTPTSDEPVAVPTAEDQSQEDDIM
jgi:hypothetical protein